MLKWDDSKGLSGSRVFAQAAPRRGACREGKVSKSEVRARFEKEKSKHNLVVFQFLGLCNKPPQDLVT